MFFSEELDQLAFSEENLHVLMLWKNLKQIKLQSKYKY